MNREKSREVLSPAQLYAVFFTLLLGRGLIVMPALVTRHAKQDGWIAMLLAGLFSLFLMNISLYLMQFFEQKTFIEISEIALGKYLGKIPGILLVVYYVIFAALAIRFIVDLSSSWLLPETPIEILSITFLALCHYLCRNGVKVLGRFSQAIMWVISPVFPLFIIPFLLYPNYSAFFPIGGSGIKNILLSTFSGFYAFLGFESVIMLYPYARERASHQEIVKVCNLSLLTVIFLKVYLVAGNIGVFGSEEIKFLVYPVLEYFKLLQFPVLKRVEFVLIYFWLFIFFGAIVGLFMLATIGSSRILRIEGYKNISLILAIPTYFLLKIPQDIAQSFKYMELFGKYGLMALLVMLTIVFTLAFIRRRR